MKSLMKTVKKILAPRQFGTLLLMLAACLRASAAAELHVPAQYPTIAEAVAAAVSGDTVRLAAGNYYEQFLIVNRTNLTIQGEPGAIVHATTEMTQTLLPYDGGAYTIVGVVRGSQVTFRDLEFHGHELADHYATVLTAIVFRGSSGRVENCVFQGFRGMTATESRAINVENHLADSSRVQNIAVLNSAFSNNKSAIILWGASENPALVRTTFNLEGNTIVGAQPSQDVLSYGVAIRIGAEGRVTRNTIADHTSALGITVNDGGFINRGSFYPMRRIVFSENIFSNNAVHLVGIAANHMTITNNIFERKAQDPRPWGVTLTGANIVVANNNFSEMPEAIALPAGELLEGVSRGGVVDPTVANNWFSDVETPVRTNAAVRGFQESGAKLCCFQPSFQSIKLDDLGNLHFAIRGWHGKPAVIETSSDLEQWSSISTNLSTIPLFELNIPAVRNTPDGTIVGGDDAGDPAFGFFRLRTDP